MIVHIYVLPTHHPTTQESVAILHLQDQGHQGLLPAPTSNKHQAHPDASLPLSEGTTKWLGGSKDPVFMVLEQTILNQQDR